MKRSWIIISILIVVGLLFYCGLFILSGKDNKSVEDKTVRNPKNTNIVVTLEPKDTIFKIFPDEKRLFFGDTNAIIKVILFVDFSNKSSLKMIDTFREIIGLDKDVSLYLYSFPVYKNELSIPLSTIFILSIQNEKKEEFKKWIEGVEEIKKEDIIEFAGKNQIDKESIFQEYKENELSKLPALSDMNMGVNFGVGVPPTYFINGIRYSQEKGREEVEKLLITEKEKINQLIKNGIKREDVYNEIVKNGKEVAYKINVVDREKTEQDLSNKNTIITEEDLRYVPYKGPRYAPVTMVIFVDYECPFTKRYYPNVKSIIENYPEDVRVFIKHYPLSKHKRSIEVASYLAAALAQKNFWTLFDRIMENPEFVDDNKVMEIASELGIDTSILKEMKSSEKIKRYVENDMIKGDELGLTVLPTTFINGTKYEGVISVARLKKIIEQEKIEAEKLLAGGIKKEELYDNLVKKNRLKNLIDISKSKNKPYIEKIK